MNADIPQRRPGRPRAIQESSIPLVLSLYQGGLGYRAIARELEKQGLLVDWSTVRRVIKTNLPGRASGKYGSQMNSDTILTLGQTRKM